MPRENRQRRRGGVSHEIRQTTFIHPSQLQNLVEPSPGSSRHRIARNEKVTRVLGPKARQEEIQRSDLFMREQLSGNF